MRKQPIDLLFLCIFVGLGPVVLASSLSGYLKEIGLGKFSTNFAEAGYEDVDVLASLPAEELAHLCGQVDMPEWSVQRLSRRIQTRQQYVKAAPAETAPAKAEPKPADTDADVANAGGVFLSSAASWFGLGAGGRPAPPKVEIYSHPACTYCNVLKEKVKAMGLAYDELPLDGDADWSAMQTRELKCCGSAVRAVGKPEELLVLMPVLFINGEWRRGPHAAVLPCPTSFA